MTEITEVSEALKLLNTLVERGEEYLKRWRYWCQGCDKPRRADESGYLCPVCGSRLLNNVWLSAMVKGARGVLKNFSDQSEHIDNGDGTTSVISNFQSQKLVIGMANDYRDALVELGWWK